MSKMTIEEAWVVLRKCGFCAYMGPGYSTEHAIREFMSQYPRGKGIKGHRKDLLELYQACLTYTQILSRTRKYYVRSGLTNKGEGDKHKFLN